MSWATIPVPVPGLEPQVVDALFTVMSVRGVDVCAKYEASFVAFPYSCANNAGRGDTPGPAESAPDDIVYSNTFFPDE